MRIFLDFDEVCVETIRTICYILNSKYNTNVNYKDIKRWNFEDGYPFVEKDEVDKIFESDVFFKFLHWKKDMFQFVLKNLDNITIITKGSKTNLLKKKIWLTSQFPNIDIILLEETVSKGVVDMSNGILVDDYEKNLFETNASIKIMFLNNPNAEWNSKFEGLKVCSVEELKQLLKYVY